MIDSLLKYRYPALIILIIFFGIALFKAPLAEINADVSQFFPEGDSDYEFYKRIKSEFKDDEQLILVGIKNQ